MKQNMMFAVMALLLIGSTSWADSTRVNRPPRASDYSADWGFKSMVFQPDGSILAVQQKTGYLRFDPKSGELAVMEEPIGSSPNGGYLTGKVNSATKIEGGNPVALNGQRMEAIAHILIRDKNGWVGGAEGITHQILHLNLKI